MQRFRDGFTAIPPMRALGRLWDRDPAVRRLAARGAGSCSPRSSRRTASTSASRRCSTSTTAQSSVIGDRALHSDRERGGVRSRAALVRRLRRLRAWAAVGQAFPGPRLRRAPTRTTRCRSTSGDLAEIAANDLAPYRALIAGRHWAA